MGKDDKRRKPDPKNHPDTTIISPAALIAWIKSLNKDKKKKPK